MKSGGVVWTALTPTVFCAVSAVIAVIPWTPQRANAFRSAWMPAPPPESEPAIERTAGMRRLHAVQGRRRGSRAPHVPAAEPAPHQAEQLELGQRPRGGWASSIVRASSATRAVAALDCVEQAALGRVERRERVGLGERRRVGAEHEVERVARVADDGGAGVQELVGAGGGARGDRAGHRGDHAAEVGGEVGGDQRAGPRRRLDHDRERSRARR